MSVVLMVLVGSVMASVGEWYNEPRRSAARKRRHDWQRKARRWN